METAEIVAISVVALIAAAEIFCLFLCSKHKKKTYPMFIAVPVVAGDTEFAQRLEYISTFIESGCTFIGSILLIDISASQEQLQLCRAFCEDYHAAELILPCDIETALKK